MARRPRFVALALGVLVAAGCGLLSPRPSAAPASGVGGWEAGPPAPAALTEVAAAAHDGRIWVAGGLDATGAATTGVYVFDPATDTWQDGPALATAIHHSSLVSDGERLWLIGGYRADGQPTDAVLVLEPGLDAWFEEQPLPEPRGAGAAAFDGAGRFVYAGGVGPNGVSTTVFVRPDAGRWEEGGRLPVAIEHLAATSDGAGTAYVLGGRRGGLDTNVATVEAVDASGTRRVGEVPTTRGGVAAFWWPSLGACLVGGESPGGTNPQVECVDPAGRLTKLPDMLQARHGLGAAVIDGVAYTLLGGDQPGLFVSDAVERLRLP